MNQLRKISIAVFIMLTLASIYFALQLKFSFDFEQFFPTGDADLAFFKEFIEEFETDDNFMLIAAKREAGVFEQSFLKQFHELTLQTRKLPYITESQSLTKLTLPLKTPFGYTTVPAIHIDKPSRYARDSLKIMQDERFVHNLISEDGKALVIALKTKDRLDLPESDELMEATRALLTNYSFEKTHLLGTAYFQSELVKMSQREVAVSAIISGILVAFILFVLFRRPIGIGIAGVSIGLGMLLFLGLLGAWGRELSVMSALYPVLMIIVGTSDVIHIMSKYIDELRKGLPRKEAITITIKEIGLATLLTSITTAIGFASLLSSRIIPIKEFGVNAAVGVIVAYVTVIFFTTALLSYFKREQLTYLTEQKNVWEKILEGTYQTTLQHPRRIIFGSLVLVGLCFWGISTISTNYRMESNLPIGATITDDFNFFEEAFAGFRPMEIAVFASGDYQATDYAVIQQMDTIEQYLKTIPSIKSVTSITAAYKSVNQANNQNKASAYAVPKTERSFQRAQKMLDRLPEGTSDIMVSKDGKKARITTRVLDIGADSVQQLGLEIDNWIAQHTDPSIATFKRTGTAIILDKNALYARQSLLEGLAFAVLIVSVIMALLFRNWRMVFISLVPNVLPLLIAGGLLGLLGIDLEAGVAILFAIVFGIAVDDTIHFLSKFKLATDKGYDVEKAIHITFLETGKAICLTSVVLFFGFLVMLFSVNPPSVTVGIMISVTLFTALISDLLIIPVLIRRLL